MTAAPTVARPVRVPAGTLALLVLAVGLAHVALLARLEPRRGVVPVAPSPMPGRALQVRTLRLAPAPNAVEAAPVETVRAPALATRPASEAQVAASDAAARRMPKPIQAPTPTAPRPASRAEPAVAAPGAPRIGAAERIVPAAPFAETAAPSASAFASASTSTSASALASGSDPDRTSTGPAVPIAIPAPARLHYTIAGRSRGRPYGGSAELLWQHDGVAYQARYQVDAPSGARLQTSSGTLGDGGLAPLRFSERVRSEVATHFERDKGRISFSANAPPAELADGAQDRLSLWLQLAALLAGAPQRYPAGSTLALPTASTREAGVWRFEVEGEDEVAAEGGLLPALKLLRRPRHEYDQTLELWLAPRLAYMPARMRLTQANGDVMDQLLRLADTP